ncbi:MAG TPA: branched-chain amino acid ABC transporter permease [Candidatus Limnocylindrales bacterium]|nr:branched-chain amino acid ABC transporter permease [Candidatus Limnocylindrales bacterium]
MRADRTRLLRIAAAVLVLLVVAYLVLGVQQFQNFLTLGAIYALIALGYTMVYGIIELINFAHGDVFMVGAFVAMWIMSGPLGLADQAIQDPVRLAGILLFVVVVTMVVMGLVGVIIERFAYRPLRHAPRLAPLITAIGVSFILQNIIQAIFSSSPIGVPQIFPRVKLDLLGGSIGVLNIFMVVVAIALMVALQLFVGRTRLGRAMRSTAQDREAAELMGVDINQTIAITFFIAAALAGSAGLIQGLYFGSIQFNLGFFAGLKAFTAAVLGGIGNTTGAAIGGFIIAFIEVFAAALGFSRWSEVAVFTVLILVLVFRPSGILGQAIGERA